MDRDKLLGNLFTRMGDSEEFRIFECLLTQSYCNLQSPWSTTRFPSQKGIRQGAIESPYLFGLLIEWVIEEVSRQHSWEEGICTYKDLHVAQIAFMDDVYLWEGRADILERKANQLRQGFLEWGLHINAEKSALYLSPKHVGKNTISLAGVHLVPQSHIDVMGMPLAVGAKVTDLLQPTWARAKGRFWSLRHLLLADAPIGERIKLLHKTVGSSMLWNSSAIHPEMTALVAINHILYQLILYMLRLRKRNDEPWADFRRRGLGKLVNS